MVPLNTSNLLTNFHETNENHLSGPSSISIVQFTVKLNEPGYGYTAATGNICIVSGDPALECSIQAGEWYDSRHLHHASSTVVHMIWTMCSENQLSLVMMASYLLFNSECCSVCELVDLSTISLEAADVPYLAMLLRLRK